MKEEIQIKKLQRMKFLFVILINLTSGYCLAQLPTDSLPFDPAISIYTTQNISFGAFSHGNAGGTISISNTGTRTATGSVTALNLGVQYFQAIFEIEAPVGTIISILNGPDVILSGSNGGTMLLQIGDSNPASPFSTVVSPPGRTPINIGGSISVGNSAANPPGSYNGVFYLIFNQE
ncbi:MAG: DUF4402 domain-containing protein [Chitinophagaceae bacterium]|nr:DUF4402 domain-containing protein [Chitinophagaceae bacterium]